MKQEEKVIMYDSPEAAQLVNINFPDGTPYGKGWVSINRRFYADENQARVDSATHIKCDTCSEVRKVNSYCIPCHDKKVRDSYFKKPFKEYDGKSFLTLHDDDTFFSDEEAVREYCYDNDDLQPENLMLVICDPNYLHKLDGSQWEDIMPEDGDGELPKEVEAALQALNAVIEKQGPISYSAGTYRTTIANNE